MALLQAPLLPSKLQEQTAKHRPPSRAHYGYGSFPQGLTAHKLHGNILVCSHKSLHYLCPLSTLHEEAVFHVLSTLKPEVTWFKVINSLFNVLKGRLKTSQLYQSMPIVTAYYNLQ